MRRTPRWVLFSGVLLAGLCVAVGNLQAGMFNFPNNTPITIGPNMGPASVFPLVFDVTGVDDPIEKVTITMHGLNHAWAGDIRMLLSGPDNINLLFYNLQGGARQWVNAEVTFADGYPSVNSVADNPIPSGTYGMSGGFSSTSLPAPAPAAPYTHLAFSDFNGRNANGTWNLWISDSFDADGGSMSGATLTIESIPEAQSVLLLTLGLAAAAWRSRSRRSRPD